MEYGVGCRLKYRYGGYAKIIAYRDENDIDFVFEDTGDVVEHTTLHLFLMRGKTPPSSRKRITYDVVRDEFDRNGYDLISTEYIGAKSPLEYICRKYRESGIQTVNWNRIHYYGCVCRYCSAENKRKILREQKITVSYQDVIEFFNRPDIKLSLIDSSNEFDTKWGSKIYYTCPEHPAIIQNKSFGRLIKEPYCAICHMRAVRPDISKYKYRDVVSLANDMGYDVVTGERDYKNAATKIICKCKKHGEFSTNMGHLVEGKGCPICKESRGEKSIRNILSAHDILFEPQKRFDGLYGVGGGKLSYDFYIPSQNLLIEYQGEYHDGTMHKISPDMQSVEKLEKQKIHDEMKRSYAKDNGIGLLEIWYFDYDNIEKILSERGVI